MRITQLQDQGYSLSHASMIATVEWALFRSMVGVVGCEVCVGSEVMVENIEAHTPDCPIPALGYAVLHERRFDPGWLFDSRCQSCLGSGRIGYMRPGAFRPCPDCYTEPVLPR